MTAPTVTALPTLKRINLTKSRLIWQSLPEETFNPFPGSRSFFQQYCYKLPDDLINIKLIRFDGAVVWKAPLLQDVKSAPLFGGGRFLLRQRWCNRTKVSVELDLKDIPLITTAPRKITVEYSNV